MEREKPAQCRAVHLQTNDRTIYRALPKRRGAVVRSLLMLLATDFVLHR